MNCGLITMNEFTNDLDVLVESLVKDLENPLNRYLDSEIKIKFLNGLKELRLKYQLDDFTDAVKEYLADDYGRYSFGMFIDDGFDYLSQLNTLNIELESTPEVQERESKTDSLSTTLEKARKNDLKGLFLNKYFILNSTGRLFFLNGFKNEIVRSLFIDESGDIPKLVEGNKGMNDLIYFYKQNLKQKIMDAVALINPNTAKSFGTFTSIESALNFVEEFFVGNNSFVSQDLLYKIPLLNQDNALSSRDRTLLEGWKSFVTMKNFDPLIKLIFGKAVGIKDMNQYDLESEDKYYLNFGDNNTTTWRDDNVDTDETEEIGSLPVLFIESLKVRDENGNSTNLNMTFADVKVAIGKMMQLFNLLNTDISDKTFNSTVTSILEEELKDMYGKDLISDLLTNYIKDKTFKQVLASAKENPAELMPIVFRLMLPIKNKLQNNVNVNPLSGNFPKTGTKTKETLQSLYYNIYTPAADSLRSMSSSKFGTNPNSITMYDFINTMILNIENKPMIEYELDYNDGIKIKSLAEKNANSRLNSITRALDGKFHKNNILGTYIDEKTTGFKSFSITDNLSEGRGININVGDYIIAINPNLEVAIYKDNKQVKNLEIDEFLPFISEVLDIPLIQKNGFTDAIDNKLYMNYSRLGGDNLSLIRLASHILYNYQVGKHMLNVTESNYDIEASKYYTLNPPKAMYHQFQPSLIPSADYGTIKTISYAKDITEGYSEVNTVRDGSGKQISTLALSSLLSKVGEIWENHTKKEDSPARNFSIFSMFEGFELIRDFSGIGGENKQGKAFTQSELAIASILYDMYGDMEEIDKEGKSSSKVGGLLRVMGPIVSDKSNLPKLKFKWDSILPKKYWKEPNKPLRLRDLNNDDIKTIIFTEFGDYYQNVYNNIRNQYNIVNKYIAQAAQNLGLEGVANFDYRTNFSKANEVFGSNAYKVLHEAIYLAQLAGENPEIIDQVGYINNKGTLENNPSLIHQLKLFGKAGSSFKTSISTDETYEQFWNRKNVQLVTDFLQSGTVLKVKNGQTLRKGQAIATAIKYNQDYLHKENIAVVRIINGDRITKISQLNDFENWYPYRQFRQSLGESISSIYDINDPKFDMLATIDAINNAKVGIEETDNYVLEINPEIIRHNLLDFFLSEEFVMATTGTYVAHPAKDKEIKKRESTQFGQAIKRYVSYTASKHRETANNLNGIKGTLNVAIIEDYYDSGLNYNGNYSSSSIKPFDGASFYASTMNYLDNNSLGGDAMGVDKKPFAHHMGLKSGIGFILKTAGFALTNDRIRTATSVTPDGKVIHFYENLNKQMLNIPWSLSMNWTEDFNHQTIDYGVWKFYDPTTNKWFARWNPRVENGETFYDTAQVTVTGEIINNTLKEHLSWGVIDTNWKLWNFFGGAYSAHKNDKGLLEYEGNNTSVQMLIKAMNNVGIKKYDKVFGLNGVDQVLKKAQIDIVATAGAVKYGGANINSNEAYFNPDYHLTSMQIDSYDIGELLDAEHHAEDGSVSLMTLVVNALGARGFSREQAEECYEALEVIAEVMNKDGLDGLRELNTSGNEELLKNSIAQIIYKTLKRVSSDDGNMLNALAATLVETGSSKFDWSNIEGQFPISHPAIFQKIISSISSELERGIRLKFEGNMFVLNPSNRIFTTINGKLAGQYKSHKQELRDLEEKNKANPIESYQIKVGYNYRSVNGGDFITVNNPSDYYAIKARMSRGEQFYETVIENDEPLGHDLSTYNAIFADTDGNYYSMWDLNSTQSLWELHDSNDEASKTELRRQLQKDLNAVAEGLESTVAIRRFNETTGEMELQEIRVDKSKTQVSPYEIILPKMYKTEFGLRTSDDLDTIKSDNTFFINRSVENWKSKVDDPEVYDLELKVLNGDHVYLGYPPEEVNYDLTKVNLEVEIDGDTMYRITPEGRRLYSIPYTIDSNGKYVPDIQVYKTFDGQEIIYSNNLSHFLDEFSYNNIIISNNPRPNKTAILRAINNSTNKTARRKVDLITRVVNRNFQNLINGSENLIANIGNTSLGSNEDLANLLFGEDLTLTFDDILEDDVLLLDAINFVSKDAEYSETLRKYLEDDLRSKLSYNELINRNPMFRGMIQSGIDTHTSFLQSLEMVVSRTPAQSQQSFMAMKIAAFAMENTNSAYVSRMQFLLLGSDLDIDKISLLGLIFNHGKLQTWSPYFNLRSQKSFEASKKLPFPTGKILKSVQQAKKRPYDVLRNDLTVSTGEFGERIINTQSGNSLIVFGTDGTFTINCLEDFNSFSPIEQYTLLRNAISKIPVGSKVDYNFEISKRNLQALGIKDGINTGEFDLNADFDEFNDSVLPVRNSNPKNIQEDIINISPKLDLLIRTYNKLGEIPESADLEVKKIVDYHNTFLKGKARKDAAQNFISIRTKDISKSPINLIQAQAAIDEQTDKVKNLLKAKNPDGTFVYPKFQRLVAQAEKADRGSVFSKFFLLTLTLAGKENVGIVASSLKNFEAISQYVYQILDEGSQEDQEDLLFNRTINGHRVRMIANSYARNSDTIKSAKVSEALAEVDNDNDAFLVKSALLSLATDNTKDPTLPKLNAGPEMLSLYNSGVILGLSIEEVANLVLSDTGILLSKLTKSNVFNGQIGFGRLTQAIQYLLRVPSVYFTDTQYAQMAPIFRRLGLISPAETFNKSTLGDILRNDYNRITVSRILRFLASPNAEASILGFDKKLFANTQIGLLKGSKDYRAFSKKREELLNTLIGKKNNLNPEENLSQKDQELLDKLNTYKYNRQVIDEQIQLLRDYRDKDIVPTNEKLVNALNTYINSSGEDFSASITAIRNNLFSSNGSFTNNINELLNWINYQDIINHDLIEGVDGRMHKVLTQITRLDEFSQELSALRPLMALNLGIPNKLVDQLDFESNFGNIILNRLNVIGKNNLERFYNVSELLSQLEEFNTRLREQGLITNTGNYFVDLNTFVSNSEYNKLIKDIYGKIKFGINIFKITDGVSHYRSYLKIANLAIQMGKKASVVYRTTRRIEDTIVPQMNARSSSHKEAIRRNIIPAIYRRLNQQFLKEQNATYPIPDFDIIDGKVVEKSEGMRINVTLGTPEANEKFKQWIQYVEFPKWKTKYPDNRFIQSLGYRIYDFNSDHNQSINLAKVQQFNMKNPSELVLFDLAKSDLLKLPSNIIDKLFLYNIIAYNNQAGLLSLTDMFEDLISANNFELIRNYNTFISNHEDLDISITEDEKLKQEIAPILSIYEVRNSLRIPYIYVRNREDGKTYLLRKLESSNSSIDEDFEDFNVNIEEDEQTNGIGFFNQLSQSGYTQLGGSIENETFQEVFELGDFLVSNSNNVKDIEVSYQGKKYSAKEILDKGKSKGFTKLSEIFPKSKKKYRTDMIESILDTIFDKNEC